jgi:hypothetical protein
MTTSLTPVAIAAQQYLLTAGAALVPGDLTVLHETGQVAPVNPNFSLALTNNTTAGATVVGTNPVTQNTGIYQLYSSGTYSNCCILANGVIASAWSGNNSTNTTGVDLTFCNALGQTTVAMLTVDSSGGIQDVRVFALLGSRVLVVFSSGATTLKFAVYNSDGSVYAAVTTIATANSVGLTYYGVAVLANGNIVFVYNKVTSNDLRFQVFTALGAVAVAEVTVSATTSPQHIAVLACANGDFVIRWFDNTSALAYRIVRYAAAGTVVNAIVTLGTYSGNVCANFSTDPSKLLVELSNGNLAFSLPGPSDNYPDIWIRSSSLAAVATVDLGNAHVTNGYAAAFCVLAGSFVVLTHASNVAWFRSFTNSGMLAIPDTGVSEGGPSFSTGFSYPQIFSLGAAGFAVYRNTYDGSTGCRIHIFTVDSAFGLRGSVYAPDSGIDSNGGSAVINSDYLMFAAYYTNQASVPLMKTVTVKVVRSSILGVCRTTTAIGGTAKIAAQGNFTINQQMSFGGNFNQRAAVVPGNRGTVAGTSAFLLGTDAAGS